MTINQSDSLIEDNLKRIQMQCEEALIKAGRSKDSLSIMAVTKTVPPEDINRAIHHGITLLGENRVQEFLSKNEQYDLSKSNIHFIGHLQRNKVKYIIDKVSMIESVSSVKLAEEINRCAQKANIKIDILLEINIGAESSKNGFLVEEIENTLDSLVKLSQIQIKGLMCIPPKVQTEKFFYKMQQLFVDISAKKIDNIDMSVLSMGMSSDYPLAIEYGSNLIRVGTALFGKRNL